MKRPDCPLTSDCKWPRRLQVVIVKVSNPFNGSFDFQKCNPLVGWTKKKLLLLFTMEKADLPGEVIFGLVWLLSPPKTFSVSMQNKKSFFCLFMGKLFYEGGTAMKHGSLNTTWTNIHITCKNSIWIMFTNPCDFLVKKCLSHCQNKCVFFSVSF